jgi:hypothetical protein
MEGLSYKTQVVVDTRAPEASMAETDTHIRWYQRHKYLLLGQFNDHILAIINL